MALPEEGLNPPGAAIAALAHQHQGPSGSRAPGSWARGTLRLPGMWPAAYSMGSRTSITLTPLRSSRAARSASLQRGLEREVMDGEEDERKDLGPPEKAKSIAGQLVSAIKTR